MIYNTNQSKLNTARFLFRETSLIECSLKLRCYCNKHKPGGGTWKLADKIQN
jgi:hypothetical protein